MNDKQKKDDRFISHAEGSRFEMSEEQRKKISEYIRKLHEENVLPNKEQTDKYSD